MKKIAICFDGTWNTSEAKDELENDATTNAYKLYASIKGVEINKDGGLPQGTALGDTATIKWYDEGVGTRWYDRIKGRAFGYGLSQNIREGYALLVRYYEPGDEIYLFGFSRGAYTARSLAGLIRNSGLLRANYVPDFDPDHSKIDEAYQIYRTRDVNADTPYAIAFRKQYCYPACRIKLVGVWDTVGALGIPIEDAGDFSSKHFRFHDTTLGRHIENAFHAVAIDEHRKPYAATLWDANVEPRQTLEQCGLSAHTRTWAEAIPIRYSRSYPCYG